MTWSRSGPAPPGGRGRQACRWRPSGRDRRGRALRSPGSTTSFVSKSLLTTAQALAEVQRIPGAAQGGHRVAGRCCGCSGRHDELINGRVRRVPSGRCGESEPRDCFTGCGARAPIPLPTERRGMRSDNAYYAREATIRRSRLASPSMTPETPEVSSRSDVFTTHRHCCLSRCSTSCVGQAFQQYGVGSPGCRSPNPVASPESAAGRAHCCRHGPPRCARPGPDTSQRRALRDPLPRGRH
jgi:hypothetical protein